MKFCTVDPDAQKMAMKKKAVEVQENAIILIMEQVGCGRSDAVNTLRITNNDVVNAIAYLQNADSMQNGEESKRNESRIRSESRSGSCSTLNKHNLTVKIEGKKPQGNRERTSHFKAGNISIFNVTHL